MMSLTLDQTISIDLAGKDAVIGHDSYSDAYLTELNQAHPYHTTRYSSTNRSGIVRCLDMKSIEAERAIAYVLRHSEAANEWRAARIDFRTARNLRHSLTSLADAIRNNPQRPASIEQEFVYGASLAYKRGLIEPVLAGDYLFLLPTEDLVTGVTGTHR